MTNSEANTIEPSAGFIGKAVPVLIVLMAAGVVGAIYVFVPAKPDKAPPRNVPPVNVEVEVIRAKPEMADTFELPAVVEPNRVVKVSAEVEGRVEQIRCTEGQVCQARDTLVLLNTDLLQAELDRAQAQAKYDQSEYDRIVELHKRGAATDREMDDTRAKANMSKATVQTAQAKLDRAKISLPIDGILNRLPIELGEYVQVGTCVAEIVDIETVKVVVQVPERDIQFLTTGSKTQVVANVKGRRTEITGAITYISELADPLTRSTRIEISVDNRERLLRSGQIVHARLTRRVLKDVIMVPLAAVIPLENAKAVYLVEGQQAQRREVQLALIKGRWVQVRHGLKPGDRLIVAGYRYVSPGQQVRVIRGER